MANCDGIPSRSQPITLSRKLFVCSCVIGPIEKRMKSLFAINSAMRSRSFAANGRRIKRGVSRTIFPPCSRGRWPWHSINHIQFVVELRLIIKDASGRTRQLAAGAGAGNEQPRQNRGGRERVHRLSALQKSNTNRLRRRPEARDDVDDRRATGRL